MLALMKTTLFPSDKQMSRIEYNRIEMGSRPSVLMHLGLSDRPFVPLI